MNLSKQIAQQFKAVHFGGNWTDVNLKDTLEGLNYKQATQKVFTFNTVAALAYHINYYVHIVMKVLEGQSLDGSDKFSFNVPEINSEAEWEALKNRAFSEAEKFSALIEKIPENKYEEIFAEEKYGNYYKNIHGIIEHCHYHLGQIVLIKKIILENN